MNQAYGKSCTGYGRANKFVWMYRSMRRRVVRAVKEKHREVHDTEQDAEDTGISTEEADIVRSKVFNFQSLINNHGHIKNKI